MAEKIECKEFEEFYSFIEQLKVRGEMRKESREELRQMVNNFQQKCSRWKTPKEIKKNPELNEMFEGFLGRMQQSIQSWNNRFQNAAKKEALGEKFRDKFIVFIYGKVKAGKSTLGNFIVNNRPTSQNVDFYIYDSNSKEKQQNIIEFATNITECTSEIQLFTLGGLVWVDTPGLGSMTKENGKLAKHYIEVADFVLYPTNSASYMQSKEIEEISELLTMQKPVHILITRSDIIEEDEDENGQIFYIFENKTTHVREEQQKDAMERLNKKLDSEQRKLIQNEILSISVEAAKRGLKDNDLELFRNSNLPRFYEQFNTILQEKAQKLKNQSPLDSIIGLIQVILGNTDKPTKESLAGLHHEYEKLQNMLETQRKNFEDSIQDLRRNIPRMIAREFDKHRIERHNYKQQCQKIQTAIGNELNTKIADACKNAMQDFAKDFCKSMESIGVTEVEDITITNEIGKKGVWGKAGGAAAGAAIGAAVGSFIPIVGTALGGIVGTAIGGLAGDIVDSRFASDDVQHIKIGDNLNESIQKFRNSLENVARKIPDDSMSEMDQCFFVPLKKQLGDIEQEIKNFCQELERLQKQYKQQRN